MLNSPHREPVAPIVVVLRIDIRTIEVQVARIRGRVVRGRPVVAARPAIVERRTIVVASRRKESPMASCHLL